MRRREVIALLGRAAAALSFASRVASAQQQPNAYRIEVLSNEDSVTDISETGQNAAWRAFFQELRRLGYVEGSNLSVGRQTGDGSTARYAKMAKAAVELHPDVIITQVIAVSLALKEATPTIPIVAIVNDPVGLGLAASIARPGANITGVSSDAGLDIYGKYVEILKSIDPNMRKVGFLVQRSLWDLPVGQAMRAAAARAGVSILGPPLESPINEAEYRRVIAAFVERGAQGVIAHSATENYIHRHAIAELLNASKLPAVHSFTGAVRAGGLVAYSVDYEDTFRVAARYVDRILKGANPANIPIYQPTKWRLVVNLRAAKTIGIELPASLVLRADEVIE